MAFTICYCVILTTNTYHENKTGKTLLHYETWVTVHTLTWCCSSPLFHSSLDNLPLKQLYRTSFAIRTLHSLLCMTHSYHALFFVSLCCTHSTRKKRTTRQNKSIPKRITVQNNIPITLRNGFITLSRMIRQLFCFSSVLEFL